MLLSPTTFDSQRKKMGIKATEKLQELEHMSI